MSTNKPLAEPLVEADWIAAHLNDPAVRLVEVDVSRAAYQQGHIPGAVFWNAYTDLRHPNYEPIGTVEFERLLSRSGLSPETSIVFYGYGAHLGFWLMKSYGHDDVRLMDGSRDGWRKAGHAWSRKTPAPVQSLYTLAAGAPRFRSSRKEVQAMIGTSDCLILDLRSQAEYEGHRFWPSGASEGAGRAGRIPGSVHLPIEKLRTGDECFRDADEIRSVLRDHGVAPGQRVVAYCTIGNRASQAWFAMSHLLNHPCSGVYYGSWAEWGTLPNTPLEIGP